MEAFAREQLALGQYGSASEVVCAGLRLLAQRELDDAAKLDALRRAVATGLACIEQGDFSAVDAAGIADFVAEIGASAAGRVERRRSQATLGATARGGLSAAGSSRRRPPPRQP
jgi:antitoxin ParD1/3/4